MRFLLPTLALAVGLVSGFVQPSGLIVGTAFVTLLLIGEKYLPSGLWWSLSLLACIALAAHALPGFSPWQLRPARQLSGDAPPYALRLSWDKLLVGLSLLAWWLGQADSPLNRLQPRHLGAVVLLTLTGVPLLALQLGVVAWQPKWPQDLWLWLAVNLGVTVLAEELLFRGLLQTRLIAWLGVWPGIALTALLFGAVHAPFSPLFALVAGVAGLGYGLAFHYSDRLSLAVGLHAAVNLLHVLLLSYPLRLV
jgi:membrane protease YdiL (CAAX protease family)